MALVVADRVQETTSTTGTSDYVLIGAADGYQSFGAVMANADTTYYATTNDTDWEVGVGTYSTTGPTLARTTILASSNGGSAVSWGVGVKNIFISYAASKSVYLDANGDLLVSDKIVHTGDTDTAIRFPAANTMSVETGGTERFKVENSTITTTVPVLLPADPTLPLQAATKEYVDTIASAGIHYHAPVRVESPINLSATYNNGTSGVGATLTNAGTQVALVIDGVTVAINDRVLIYTQTDQTQNGVYVVTNAGSGSTNWVLTRSSDTDTYGPSDPDGLGGGDAFFVQQGMTGAGELYVCNNSGAITFGTTNITFTQIAATAVYTAGSGLTLTGTVFSNAAPDQTVTLTQGGATTISGTYPNFTITSTDTTYSAGNGIGLAGTTFSVAAGSGLTQDATGLSHADTSSQASVDNTGATFVQDINLDGFGHVTGAASVTVTPSLIGAPQNDGTGATGTWNISISGNSANVNGTVAVANGGTGATTTGQARTNLDVPSTTGGGASGTWSISISGNAATATSATDSTKLPLSGGTLTGTTTIFNSSPVFVLRDSDSTGASQVGWISFQDNGGAERAWFGYGSSGNTDLNISNSQGAVTIQGSVALHAGNYTSYAPSLTGSGASGTWGINVTGSAGSVGGYGSGSLWRSDGGVWNPGANITLSQSGNGQEWSFDISRNGYTGGFWHVWDSSHGTMLGVDATSNYVYATGSFRAPIFYNNSNTSYYWQPSASSAHRLNTPSGYLDLGPMNSSWCHFQTDRARFYFGTSVTVDGDIQRYSDSALYLNSANYTSYAPSLTGSGASGTWGININGTFNSGARCYSYEWIEMPNFSGLYSGNNSAHFYPNNGTYGSWKVDGSRNGWQGIEFQGQATLMMNDDTYGFHRNIGGGWRFYVTGGSGYFPGNVTAYWSDERLKENLVKIDREALSILGQISAFRFNWNSKVSEIGDTIPVGKEEIGLIAQHVQRALPDAVVVNKAGAKIGDDNFDYLTINYDRITPLLVEATNIHEDDIASLKEKIAKLEALVSSLIDK